MWAKARSRIAPACRGVSWSYIALRRVECIEGALLFVRLLSTSVSLLQSQHMAQGKQRALFVGLVWGTARRAVAWSWVGCCLWLPPDAPLWDGAKWSRPPAQVCPVLLLLSCEAQGEGEDRKGERRKNACHKGRGSRLKLGIERSEYVAGTGAALLSNCRKPVQGYP